MNMFTEMANTRGAVSAGRTRVWKMSPLARREAIWGLIFISPWLIGFFLFYLVPMIISFGFSLFDFTLSNPEAAHFIGLENWRRMLLEDPNTWSAMWVTFRFALISFPIGMGLSFSLALLLNSKYLIGRNLFRTLFYAPTMVPFIASILIWAQVLNPNTGWINRLLNSLGVTALGTNGLRWLDDPNLIYIAYTFIGIWGIGNTILIYLASLQGVPTELYEASRIDGAGWWSSLWNITIPMVTPVIFYNLITSLVGLLQYFIVPWVLNNGNGYPEGSTRFYMVHFYQQAFNYQNMGYGAALAWLLFIVALAITIFLFATARYWVY
ncbi:MAG TPA: sugar ABC transporter permease, partial [Phototrophicaceae bacterium]|nr:sugar ABC transporter permease [Phototrophicaceae bacterium]